MVNVISNPPNSDDFDKSLYRHSSLVCEILTCIIPRMLDLIVGSTESSSPASSSSQKAQDGSRLEDAWNGNSMDVEDSINKSTTKLHGAELGLSNNDVSFGSPTDTTDATAVTDQSNKPGKTMNLVLENEISIVDSRPRLSRLLHALQPDVGLNPLTASFLSRVLVHLAVNRSQVVIPYMRKFPNLLENIVARLHLTAMADLLIQLAQQEHCARTLFEWFADGNLVPRLIDCFVPSNSWEVHESAAHCLIQLILILRTYLVNNAHSGPSADPAPADFGSGLPANNPYAILMNEDEASLAAATRLLDILESEETMSALLARLTENDQATTSIVVNCIEVFVTVLDKRRPETGFSLPDGGPMAGMELEMWLGDNLCNPANIFRTSSIGGPSAAGSGGGSGGNASPLNPASSAGDSRLGPNGTGRSESIDKIRIARASVNLARACRSRLSQLHALLQHAHEQNYNRMNTTAGLLDPPLGRCRLSVAQFFALLAALPVHTGIQEAMVADGVIKTLMSLFEMYPLNTLLHQAVRDFIVALFTHARVIEKTSGSNQTADRAKITTENNTSTVQNLNSAPTITTDATTTIVTPTTATAASSTRSSTAGRNSVDSEPMEIDAPEARTTETVNLEPICTVLDESVRTILRDHLIIEWCLRLSPIPKNCSQSDPNTDTAPVHASNRHPKPGYSGHLWQLANLIQDARTGPRGEWVNGLLQSLDPASLKSWDDFVRGDLAIINREQTPDSSFGGLNSGKLSLFLALLASQQSQQPDDSSGPDADQFVLKLSTRMNNDVGAANGDDDDDDDDDDVADEDEEDDDNQNEKGCNNKAGVGELFGIRRKKRGGASKSIPQFLPSSMWVGASEDTKPTSENYRSGSQVPDSTEPVDQNLLSPGRTTCVLGSSKFSRIRGTILDSDDDDDDSYPDDLNPGQLSGRQTDSPVVGKKDDDKDIIDDDDDDEEEEENLKSPIVIRQQRSTAGKTASIIHFPKIVGGVPEHGILSTTMKPSVTAIPVASFASVDVESDPWASASPVQGTTSGPDGWACFDNAPIRTTENKPSAFGEANQSESWPPDSTNEGSTTEGKSSPSTVNGVSKTKDKSPTVGESAPSPSSSSVPTPTVVPGSLPKPAST
ncbi:hypothetical protein FGIG_03987 [Fasciola gigantica]|uniref:Serine/threonine-protein phosphatase 6 regulatory subunit 3 n=1 Tax=Fasciola gigantica TaxID=46835 RepID=A0A504Z0Q3_FASGI|nr:hypothetical protein FGIG_03987 [Fasciola gigantica]